MEAVARPRRTLALIFAGLTSLAACAPSGLGAQQGWVTPLPDDAHPRLAHGTFTSRAMDVDVGYVIYLPPGYEDAANSERRYPVVYYLHGGLAGNETRSIGMVRYFDSAIEAGVVPPRIYVFVNGGPHSHYDYGDALAETAFVDELIPHVDSAYRTVAHRSGRAIEGFSAGGRGTARIMFKRPDLFCSAAPMAGGHQQERLVYEGRARESNSGIQLDQSYNSWALAERYAASPDAPKLSILIVVGTEDFNYRANLDWMAHLEGLGIPFEQVIVPDVPHSAVQVYDAVGREVMTFHERCFGGG